MEDLLPPDLFVRLSKEAGLWRAPDGRSCSFVNISKAVRRSILDDHFAEAHVGALLTRLSRTSLLLQSASAGRLRILEHLLDERDDFEEDVRTVRDLEQNSMLHLAVENGQIEAVRMLLSRGPVVGSGLRNQELQTPLHVACAVERDDVVRLLISAGADPNARDVRGRTPLYICCSGRPRTLRAMLGAADVDLPDADSWTPVHAAAWYGDRFSLRLLLEAGASVDLKNDDGYTALHVVAPTPSFTPIFADLLDAGFGVNVRSHAGYTPLHIAAINGNVAHVKALLATKRADLGARTNDGNTPLHLAAKDGRADLVSLLLRDGSAAVDAKNNDGDAPLHLAANHRILRELIGAGADANVQNNRNQTPLHLAVARDDVAGAKTLLDAGARDDLRDCGLQKPIDRTENPYVALVLREKKRHIKL